MTAGQAHPGSGSQLLGIARFTFHDGGAEEFTRLSRVCLDIVRAQDTGTLQNDVYLNAEHFEAIVVERYEDSAALGQHLAHIGPELMAAVSATGSVRGVLLGAPSEQIVAGLEGSPVQVFARVMSLQDAGAAPAGVDAAATGCG